MFGNLTTADLLRDLDEPKAFAAIAVLDPIDHLELFYIEQGLVTN